MARLLRVLVRFGYVGDRFYGVAPQPDVPTVGAALRKRLEDAAGTRARRLAWVSRTDRGVHAVENMATAGFPQGTDVARLALGVAVPRDDGLRRVSLRPVPDSVHARSLAEGKHYVFRIQDAVAGMRVQQLACWLGRRPIPVPPGAEPPVSLDRRCWQVAPALDASRMHAAGQYLVGEQNFRSFVGGPIGEKNPVRRVTRVRVVRVMESGQSIVRVDIEGTSFLRYMVRNIVGLLVEVGAGIHPLEHVSAVLSAQDRSAAGVMAPARGLCLQRIHVARDWFGQG